jgi:arylsulfatase A-like enzyme
MNKRERQKPNVLLICVDHWPGKMLGAAGHPCVITPTLDQLAANGVRYSNTYSATPTCIPARRALMTGTTARTHGDRVFSETLPMPDLPTLAQTFSEAGYQAYAVGKLHVYPQRNRIGFADVLLNEEGRHHLGLSADDYELFLATEGYAGQEYAHGMPTTDYITRPWHLPEYLHPTNWTAREMCRVIRRRDPTRPAFWYLSFNAPHPPLVPLVAYQDMYREVGIPEPYVGDWAGDFEHLPHPLKSRHNNWYALLKYANGRTGLGKAELRLARRAFYALCTHIDHQIRLVLGTLREEGLLDDTLIVFTSDHGDMLGNHGQFAKGLLYEDSARVPLIIMPTADYGLLGHHQVDDRLVELRDIMPTLLDLAGISIPESVEGASLLSNSRREHLYGEHYDGEMASRMLRNGRHKIIYYPAGNRLQLFDLQEDPDERHNLAGDPSYRVVCEEMVAKLLDHLYGEDLQWVDNGKLVGLPDQKFEPKPNRGLTAQRGWRFM